MISLYGRWYSTSIQALNIYIASKRMNEFQFSGFAGYFSFISLTVS